MDTPEGRVVGTPHRQDRAIVDVDVRETCPRCAAGRGCGAGLFSAGRPSRRIEAIVDPGLDLHAGDRVRIELAPSNVLQAALFVYGLPLAAAALAAAAGFLLKLGDAAAAALSLLGLLAGFFAARRLLARQSCLARLTPVVRARLPDDGSYA